MKRSSNRSASFALAPTWLVATIVFIGTMVWSLNLSFTDSRIFPSSNYVGLAQYSKLFSSVKWLASIHNIFIFGLIYILGCLLLGFLLAAALDRKIRFENLLRTIFLYPYAISFVVTGLVWQWMLNPTLGIQTSMRSLGWESFTLDWISNRETAIYAIGLAGIWQGAGLVMIIVLAGMRGIEAEQWKAARIDGIPVWRTYVSIVIPQLGPALGAASMLLAMGVVRTYDIVVAMTNGGPGNATEVPAKFIMDNLFERQNLGLATAGATTLVAGVVLIVLPLRYAIFAMTRMSGGR